MALTPQPFHTGPIYRTGIGVPPGNLGFDGDYYIDQNDTNTFYGPKGAGQWGPLQRLTVPNATTGLIGGMLMTKVNSTTINITAGSGKIVDYTTNYAIPKLTPIQINNQNYTLSSAQLANPVNWFYVDINGNVQTQTTRPQHVQRRQVIQIGAVTCASNTIQTVTPAATYIPQGTLQLYDLLYELGPFVAPPTAGNIVSGNSGLTIAKSAGETFNPSAGYVNGPNEVHYIANPAENPCTVQYATQVAGSEATPTTAIDNGHWDNAGTVTAVSGGAAVSTIQRVFLVPTGVAGTQVVIQYGQALYSNLNNAIAGIGNEVFNINPDLDGTAALLCWLVVTSGATGLQNKATSMFQRANRFAFP